MGTEGGGVEICCHCCWGRRPGLTVIVIRPTAAVTDPIFFLSSTTPPPSWSEWYSNRCGIIVVRVGEPLVSP